MRFRYGIVYEIRASGLVDASDFQRKDPFLGRTIVENYADDSNQRKMATTRFLNVIRTCCDRTGEEDEEHECYRRFSISTKGWGTGHFDVSWHFKIAPGENFISIQSSVMYRSSHFILAQVCHSGLLNVEYGQLHDQMLRQFDHKKVSTSISLLRIPRT